MPKRRDHMLEAFRESSRMEKEPSPPRPRAGEALPFPDKPGEVAGPNPPSPSSAREEVGSPEPEVPPPGTRRAEPDLVGVASLPGRSAPSAARADAVRGGDVDAGAARAAASGARTRITLPMGREWFFGLATVALTVAFLLGRWSAGTVAVAAAPDPAEGEAVSASRELPRGARLAGNPASPGPLAAPADASPPAGSRTATPELSPADRAFLDPQNVYTVVAITYDDTENGRQLAIDTYRHLESRGFDVVYPRRKDGRLLIFVGAAAGYRDLESVESRLRREPGPNGRLAFTGAYRVNIADYR